MSRWNKSTEHPALILPYGKRKAPVVVFVKVLARVILSAFFRLRPEGVGNLPAQGPFVLMTKHHRWEDIPLNWRCPECGLDWAWYLKLINT